MDASGPGSDGSCYYSLLGIRRNASASDIRSAYRCLALVRRPHHLFPRVFFLLSLGFLLITGVSEGLGRSGTRIGGPRSRRRRRGRRSGGSSGSRKPTPVSDGSCLFSRQANYAVINGGCGLMFPQCSRIRASAPCTTPASTTPSTTTATRFSFFFRFTKKKLSRVLKNNVGFFGRPGFF